MKKKVLFFVALVTISATIFVGVKRISPVSAEEVTVLCGGEGNCTITDKDGSSHTFPNSPVTVTVPTRPTN